MEHETPAHATWQVPPVNLIGIDAGNAAAVSLLNPLGPANSLNLVRSKVEAIAKVEWSLEPEQSRLVHLNIAAVIEDHCNALPCKFI